MFALVDCNCFFCSVEQAFHPGLKGKPVCVLSSNDGCVVALTAEAKAIGMKRGEPIFKMMDLVKRHHVTVFSGNMYLYAAMSKRVTNILRNSVNYVENYSIDESFCWLDNYDRCFNVEEYMRQVANRIKLWTDIPVSVGIASTKTLAKMGSKFAKQYKGYRSVCLIDTDNKRRKALALFDLADVWGIGRRTLVKLNANGIRTPLEFADAPEDWVRNRFPLPIWKTWRELNGTPCIDTAEVLQRQHICTSRSFGSMVTDIGPLRESVATFASSCANKLRAQHSVAGNVSVFLMSNRFREDLPQYAKIQCAFLPIPSSDTMEITQAALSVLQDIYRPGIQYKKSGVILGHIADESVIQQDLFDKIPNRPERHNLMNAIDLLNHKFGVKSIRQAAEGGNGLPWQVKREHCSGNYLCDINEILTVRI